MKEQELRKHARCAVCNQPIGHTGLPLFWTVVIERHGIKMEAVKRQDGLSAVLGGNVRLAQVMGTDAEMTETVLGPVTITVCEACAIKKSLWIAQLAESAA